MPNVTVEALVVELNETPPPPLVLVIVPKANVPLELLLKLTQKLAAFACVELMFMSLTTRPVFVVAARLVPEVLDRLKPWVLELVFIVMLVAESVGRDWLILGRAASVPCDGVPMPKNESKVPSMTPWPMIDPPLFSVIAPGDCVFASPMKMIAFVDAPMLVTAVATVHSLPSVQLPVPTAADFVK